ncbi:MAG: response regulator transcription factor [Gaiellaceae bacterium]
MSTLLLAEPEAGTREFLARHLADDGFDVLGEPADARPDLVLLGDPGALDQWRERDVPVIVLGGSQADAVDRVRAFDRGCDDFVTRPFHYDELVARIRAVLRRASPPAAERMEVGEIEIDRRTRAVVVRGRHVLLAAKEYELLLKLASDPQRVFTKEELLRDVWGFRSLGRTRTLDSHASRLRRKLGQAGADACVLNVWGVGYRLLEDASASGRSR